MFGRGCSGPGQDRRVERSRFVLHRGLVVQIECGGKDLSRLGFVVHRVPALPAESVLLLDLRSTLCTCANAVFLFLRGDHRHGLRFWFCMPRDWWLWLG